jgi:hypothetical protein
MKCHTASTVRINGSEVRKPENSKTGRRNSILPDVPAGSAVQICSEIYVYVHIHKMAKFRNHLPFADAGKEKPESS